MRACGYGGAVVNPAPTLSRTCAGWASTAGFTVGTHECATTLRPTTGHGTSWYQIRDRGQGRVELTEIDADGDEHTELYAAGIDILERFLIGLLRDGIREDLDLDYLDLPWTAELVAPGFTLGPFARGYRTLSRTNGRPVAAARDETLSLVKLVPLSHFILVEDLEALKRAFLSSTGAPLLTADGRYRAL